MLLIDINQNRKEPQDSARICYVFLWESVPTLLSFESSFVYFAKQKNYSEGLLAPSTPVLDIPVSSKKSDTLWLQTSNSPLFSLTTKRSSTYNFELSI